jgi:ornithine decarboxylase
MTFDSLEELHKIKAHFPEAECVVRIAVLVTDALYNLSEKFGVTMEEIPEILKTGKKLNLKIVGVAFHVGSGGVTFEPYKTSILNAR